MNSILDKANDLKKQAFKFVGDQIKESTADTEEEEEEEEEEETEADATIKKKKKEPYRNPPKNATAQNATAQNATAQNATAQNATDAEEEDVPAWKRIVNKGIDKGMQYGALVIVPFIALVMASFVANDMIIYSKFMRIIFFIFTFLMTYLYNDILVVVLPVYYILRTFYRRYLNSVEQQKDPAYDIRKPLKIYAFLPLFQGMPEKPQNTIASDPKASRIGYYAQCIWWAMTYPFCYPFCYDKSEKDTCKLSQTCDDEWGFLITSFADYDTYKETPPYKNRIEHAKTAFQANNSVELSKDVKSKKPCEDKPVLPPPLPPGPRPQPKVSTEKQLSNALSKTLSETQSKANK